MIIICMLIFHQLLMNDNNNSIIMNENIDEYWSNYLTN